MGATVKAILLADTAWLWYAVGRWGSQNSSFERPRVDYMSLRNQVTGFLIERFGNIYDLECHAVVVDQSRGTMHHFMDLLRGFGYRVQECIDPTPAMISLLKDEQWDLVVLAIGSVEVLATADAMRKDGRKVVAASFNGGEGHDAVDAVLHLDGKVLYEGARPRV